MKRKDIKRKNIYLIIPLMTVIIFIFLIALNIDITHLNNILKENGQSNTQVTLDIYEGFNLSMELPSGWASECTQVYNNISKTYLKKSGNIVEISASKNQIGGNGLITKEQYDQNYNHISILGNDALYLENIQKAGLGPFNQASIPVIKAIFGRDNRPDLYERGFWGSYEDSMKIEDLNLVISIRPGDSYNSNITNEIGIILESIKSE
jgi:hypothetical protein